MDSDTEITPIIIDFEQLKNADNQINEIFNQDAMLGASIEMMLKAMFGGVSMPVRVKGTQAEVESFVSALSREKKYLDTAKRHGLTDPRVVKNKAKLEAAANKFYRQTGIKWPFK
jgi:hypothetical protein